MARSIGIACAGALLLAQHVGAVALTVTNAGFEDPPLADDAATDDVLPGWTGSGGVLAEFNFGAFDPPTTFFPAGAPEGENVGYIQDGQISQLLADTLEPGTYTLTVLAGQSLVDVASPWVVQLRAGGTVLNEVDSPLAAAGEFTEVVVGFVADAAHPSLGEPLEIVLVDGGQPGEFADEPYFDAVSLDFEEVAPAGCAAAPAKGCVAAAKATLAVQEKKAGKEKLTAKLQAFAAATTAADFGDPVAGATAYELCIYTAEGTLAGALSVDRAGANCGAKPCWKAKGTSGWAYKDALAGASGVRALAAKAGAAGKGKLQLKAGNNAAKGQTALPTGIAAALQGATSATLQFLTSDALCLEATLGTVKAADGVQFKAKAP
jgi:hypothetical protein